MLSIVQSGSRIASPETLTTHVRRTGDNAELSPPVVEVGVRALDGDAAMIEAHRGARIPLREGAGPGGTVGLGDQTADRV